LGALALIPARGGSKAIPGKNVARVGGRPLIAWTIEAARAACSVDRVVVSTDSSEIASVARGLGAEVLDRPAGIAADDTPMLDVVLHALAALGDPDTVVLLQPTSPLRRAEHVDEALELLESTGADCVVSVEKVPHRYRPASLVRLDGDRVVALEPDAPTTRQAKPLAYARNGPAVLAFRTAGLGDRGSLYDGDCRGFVMGARESIDVDEPFDLELADLLLGEARR
jgi:CMP-N,N'-diacetyllegionaminic acid synthase